MMVKAGLTEELQICLQNGIDVDYLTDMDAPEGMKMQSALHIATSEKHLETMKMLMDMGANLNVQDAKNDTPLHIACNAGNFRVINLLIEKGPQLIMYNTKGWSALHCCLASGQTNSFVYMIEII